MRKYQRKYQRKLRNETIKTPTKRKPKKLKKREQCLVTGKFLYLKKDALGREYYHGKHWSETYQRIVTTTIYLTAPKKKRGN